MTEILKYRIVYAGGDADDNRLPGHAGAISIEGLTWSLSLVGHYAAEGQIRARGKLSDKIKVYLAPARQGSYIQDVWVAITEPNSIYLTSVAGSYAIGTASQAINSLIGSALRGVCGLTVSLLKREERLLSSLPSGDQEALIDKIEPSMRRVHSIIDEGVTTITLKKGTTSLVKMDTHTKDYVNADLLTDETILVVSVGAYNANTGNGSAYVPNVGKSVSFFAPEGLDDNTYAALSYSLDQYVNKLPSDIEIACRPTVSVDGRLKRLRIVRAFKLKGGSVNH